MNLSDVELSEPDFTDHADSAWVHIKKTKTNK